MYVTPSYQDTLARKDKSNKMTSTAVELTVVTILLKKLNIKNNRSLKHEHIIQYF